MCARGRRYCIATDPWLPLPLPLPSPTPPQSSTTTASLRIINAMQNSSRIGGLSLVQPTIAAWWLNSWYMRQQQQQRQQQQLLHRVTLGPNGGHRIMESACQIKGSKVNNRKQAKHDVHNGSRALTKDHTTTSTTNSLNGSDEENQEDNGAARHNNNNAKKNTKNNSNSSNSTPTSTTPFAVVNGNGNSNHKVNKPAISSGNTDNNNKINKDKVSYNKVVSNGIATTTTTSTADLPYNKVVSNGIATTTTTTTTPDLAYNKLVSNGLTTTTATTTTTAPELAYNKVVSNGIATTNEIGYTKVTPNYISYSKIVNGNDDKTKMTINATSTIANTNVANESNDAVNKENTNGVNNNNNNHENKPKTKPSEAQAQQRRAVLSYEQVCRLSDVMNEVVCIHGRGNFPTLEVRLRDLVKVVKAKLEADPSSGGAGMKVRDIRLNGGAASHVLATESQPYNDLDLIFGVELSSSRNYDKVKAAVLGSLFDLLPEGVSRKRITTCSLKEAYVSKMVKVNNDGDRWSLISLGNSRGHRNVELKFVDTMRRQFEFSVDSFQIVLDSLLLWHESCKQPISECLYPNVVGESVYGDFHEALYHLQKKLISTRHPEEIRGGGLLKYCNLLVKMYKAAQPDYIKTLERYMCSRFFIDFPDIGQQKAKLENYLWNHFVGPEEESLKYQYLIYLHNVVEESTVCLMGHERRQTLALIQSLAYQVLCQDQHRLNTHHSPAPAYLFANGYYYAPVIPTACYPCTCSTWMACSS